VDFLRIRHLRKKASSFTNSHKSRWNRRGSCAWSLRSGPELVCGWKCVRVSVVVGRCGCRSDPSLHPSSGPSLYPPQVGRSGASAVAPRLVANTLKFGCNFQHIVVTITPLRGRNLGIRFSRQSFPLAKNPVKWL
jgi:hypothetical protein